MGHTHDHPKDSAYYTEQLCTIGVCGAMGAVAVLMSTKKDVLSLILAPSFHPYVFWGGVALLLTVAVRAISVWKTVGTSHGHEEHHHDHEHDCCGGHADCASHEHDHDHEHHHHHEHGHEHQHALAHSHEGHDHAWNPWRYAVLLLPITLFFLNLPNKGISDDTIANMLIGGDGVKGEGAENFVSEVGVQMAKPESSEPARVQKVVAESPAAKAGLQPGDVVTRVTNDADVTETAALPIDKLLEKLRGKSGTKVKLTLQRGAEAPFDVEVTREDKVIPLEFKELERAAFSPMSREFYTGRRGRLKGQYFPKKDNVFTLIKEKVTCCQADMVVLQVLIEAPDAVQHIQNKEWVEVEGQIRFDQFGNKFVPVLHVAAMDKIQKTKAESEALMRQ